MKPYFVVLLDPRKKLASAERFNFQPALVVAGRLHITIHDDDERRRHGSFRRDDIIVYSFAYAKHSSCAKQVVHLRKFQDTADSLDLLL